MTNITPQRRILRSCVYARLCAYPHRVVERFARIVHLLVRGPQPGTHDVGEEGGPSTGEQRFEPGTASTHGFRNDRKCGDAAVDAAKDRVAEVAGSVAVLEPAPQLLGAGFGLQPVTSLVVHLRLATSKLLPASSERFKCICLRPLVRNHSSPGSPRHLDQIRPCVGQVMTKRPA